MNSELCKIFTHKYAGSALPLHGHERPRDKGVNSDVSFQQCKPHPVQPASKSQKSNKVNMCSEHVIVLVLCNVTVQVMRSYQNMI